METLDANALGHACAAASVPRPRYLQQKHARLLSSSPDAATPPRSSIAPSRRNSAAAALLGFSLRHGFSFETSAYHQPSERADEIRKSNNLKRAPSENAGPQATPTSIRAKKGRATPVEQWHARPCKMKGAKKKCGCQSSNPSCSTHASTH